MIFEHTWQNETVLHQAYVDEGDVLIAEVTSGGDLVEDYVSYNPTCGASDDELTAICDDIYQTLLNVCLIKYKEVA